MFADILSRDKSEYDKLWKKDYCWEVEYVQASADEEKKKLFSFYALIFDGRCLTTVKQLGWSKVDTVFKKFEAEFGNVTKQDLYDLELKFEKKLLRMMVMKCFCKMTWLISCCDLKNRSKNLHWKSLRMNGLQMNISPKKNWLMLFAILFILTTPRPSASCDFKLG